MNKQELVDKATEIASAALEQPVTKKVADAVVSAAMEAIMSTLSEGEKVTLVGFGTFERRDRAARTGRNPKSGEEMTIPAAKVPAFSSGKLFKERVNISEKTSKKTSKKA